MEQITQQTIDQIKQNIGNTIEFNAAYGNCLILKETILPEGYSKHTTDIMFLTSGVDCHVLLDGDVQWQGNLQNKPSISEVLQNGWRQLLLTPKATTVLETIDQLRVKYGFKFDAPAASSMMQKKSALSISNVNIEIEASKASIQYEYQGESSIIAQEIWSLQGTKIKNLGVQEAQDGVITQIWDWKDEQGDIVPIGIYILKLRCSKQETEVTKLDLIHKPS
jgi:hypothetical protein